MEVKGGFLGLVTRGDETTEEIDEEVGRTAAAGMFDLGDVLELIKAGFDNRPFAQQQLLGPEEYARFHLALEGRHQAHAKGRQKFFGQGVGEVAFIGEEGAEEGFRQFWDRLTIIGITRSEGHLQ